MAITNEQLADLLIGVARSQQAIIDAVARHLGHNAGMEFRGRSVIPILQGHANIGNHGAPVTLQDLPARLLLQLQGRPAAAQRLEDWLTQELERLIP